MTTLPDLPHDVGHGSATSELPDWRKDPPSEVDDDAPTPDWVTFALGFDPEEPEIELNELPVANV